MNEISFFTHVPCSSVGSIKTEDMFCKEFFLYFPFHWCWLNQLWRVLAFSRWKKVIKKHLLCTSCFTCPGVWISWTNHFIFKTKSSRKVEQITLNGETHTPTYTCPNSLHLPYTLHIHTWIIWIPPWTLLWLLCLQHHIAVV